MTWPCPEPEFPWNAERGWNEACTKCGRTAWYHEQSDPLADVIAFKRWIGEGHSLNDQPPPPAMKP